MFRSRIQRLSFVIAILGIALVAFGCSRWVADPKNRPFNRTYYIPDYPITESDLLRAFVQIHHSCEWVSEQPREMQRAPVGKLVVDDRLLSIDVNCAMKQIETSGGRVPNDARFRFSLLFWTKQSDQLLIRECIRSDLCSEGEVQKDCGVMFREKILDAPFRELGIPVATAQATVNGCLKAEPRWCIETKRITRINVMPVLRSNYFNMIGASMLLFGMLGSVFNTPVAWVWRVSLGRLVAWIKVGN